MVVAPGGSGGGSSRVVVAGLVGFFLLLELPLLTEVYRITVDEPWYSQVAYSVARGDGFHNPVVGSGGGDVFFLYTSLLAGFYELFGTSFYVGRLFSVFCGAISTAG
jgi:hypothetical protein